MEDRCLESDTLGAKDGSVCDRVHPSANTCSEPGTPSSAKPVAAAARLREVRLHLLAEATFEGICIHQDGTILDANPQFCDMFGYSLEELRGKDCFSLIAPQSRQMVRDHFSEGFEGPYESVQRRKDGSLFPVEIRVRQFQVDGQVLRFAVFRDLTDRKAMERQLADREKKYRQLYDHSPVALYRTRIGDGKLLECNEALVQLFGYANKEEIQSDNVILSYVHPEDRADLLKKLEKDKRVEGFQTQLKRKDGQLLWVEITAEAPEGCDYLEGSIRDISASRVLTPMEKKVFRLLIEGNSNKEIARLLKRSTRTIEDHRARCMRKLGASSLAELVQKAHSLGPETTLLAE